MPTTTGVRNSDWRTERARKAATSRTRPAYYVAKIRDHVARTRTEQGLPPVSVDDMTLGQIAELFRAVDVLTEARGGAA